MFILVFPKIVLLNSKKEWEYIYIYIYIYDDDDDLNLVYRV